MLQSLAGSESLEVRDETRGHVRGLSHRRDVGRDRHARVRPEGGGRRERFRLENLAQSDTSRRDRS